MKIGMRAHDFGRNQPHEFARMIKDAGFETVQLALTKAISGVNSFADINTAMLEKVRRGFDDNAVDIGVLGCYVEIGLPDKQARLNEVEKFLNGLEHAKLLGVSLVGTETTNFPPDLDSEREATYQNLKDSVLRMAERAERLEVDIGIETVADHTLNSAELTRRLLDEVNSKRLKVIFDPVNLILSQHDINNQEQLFNNFLETVGMDISALHVKDIVLTGNEKTWRNIGKGDIRYQPIFKWLMTHRPDIPALREHVKPESYTIDIEAMRNLLKTN